MQRLIYLFSFFFIVVSIFSVGVPLRAQQEDDTDRKIVVFHDDFSNPETQDKLIAAAGGFKLKDLKIINGKVVRFRFKAAERALLATTVVKRIDPDVPVFALGRNNNVNDDDDDGDGQEEKPVRARGKRNRVASSQPAEIFTWNIDRIDAEKLWPGSSTTPPNTGTGIKVAVLDTGISTKHPDLKVVGGVNTINVTKSFNDDNGHGSHVAGVIAALDNTVGVIGAGPTVSLYAVKVLGANGSGFLSDVIEGIDWAIQNGMRVVNMSLGTSSDIQSLHEAIIRARNANITQVAAAGNSGGAISFPAAYQEVIAVSATDEGNAIASFSSRGADIDLAAPGVRVYSTYKGISYATLSGTSMAAPHVAGAAALLLKRGTCDFNQDGVCTSQEVQQRLETTATDLGAVGKDYLYGAGLVNAWNAVQ